jgi:purine-binding chemotaxis protein CheW
MDLAAIRKKANADKKSDQTPARSQSDVRPQFSMQGAPLKSENFEDLPPLIPILDIPEEDPLSALFAAPLDMDLATEETYFQALSGKEEKDEVEGRKFLTFVLDEEEYALDITFIREIIKTREITDIPRVPDFILGIISLRGIIVPVFDLKQRLQLGRVNVSEASRIIVCNFEDRIIGLLVDHISQVVQLPKHTVEPPPSVLTGIDREMVEGVGRYQGRMMILLNLPCVMNAELV